jgi:protein AATF/BFR2
VSVDKSKLRKPKEVVLGPQYSGTLVRREAIDDEESDDPFTRHFEDNDDSTEESDDEVVANGVTRQRNKDDAETESGDFNTEDIDRNKFEIEGNDIEENDNAGSFGYSSEGQNVEDYGDGEDSEDEGEETEITNDEDEDIERAELIRILKEDSQNVAATISKAVESDIEKGEAIKAQRKAFDALLNIRIRLQKAIIASNTLAISPTEEGHDSLESAIGNSINADAAILAAETAALTLLTNLTSLRSSLDSARIGSKRKASVAFTPATSLDQIWTTIKASEHSAWPHRKSTLEKWSAKTRPTQIIAPRNRLNNTEIQQSLTSVLEGQMADTTRLIAKTQQPRSCAPALREPSEKIYDDADFYGLLLKELLEQRSADINTSISLPLFDTENGNNSGVMTSYRLAKEAKTKKVVDTRASKGRKLRYTVHEKLQNFMAPEDRGTWGERQADELFGSLLGKRMELQEDVDSEGDVNMEDTAVDGGLMLFRN